MIPRLNPLESQQTYLANDEPTWDVLNTVIQSCRRRVRSWRVPPNWSRGDWFEEIEAIQAIAAWRARCAYDPASGIKYEAFVYLKVMAGALTRYRQEWLYALRFIPTDDSATGTESSEGTADRNGSALGANLHTCSRSVSVASRDLDAALLTLSEGQRTLIRDLFTHGCSEAEIGKTLGIGQRAVSKRKHVILKLLRDHFQMLATSIVSEIATVGRKRHATGMRKLV